MNDVVPTFPLLRLPIDVILNTFRIMNHLEIFGISLLSKKTKNLVEFLKLETSAFHVMVTDSFNVILHFPNDCWLNFKFYQIRRNGPLQELEMRKNVYISSEDTNVLWKNVMSVKQVLDHLQLIFHSSETILYFGGNCEQFNLESIHRNVKNFQSICFSSGNHEQNRRILSFFQPASLVLLHAALDNGHVPRCISIQNFDSIRAAGVEITLDSLLMTNALSISLICDVLSIKIPNRFLKLWVKGSNPRLEYVFLQFRQADFQEEELLRGLKLQYIPQSKRRLFKVSGKKGPQEVNGGWNIQRFDGTQATISADIKDGHVRFELFVWHDHCVVD